MSNEPSANVARDTVVERLRKRVQQSPEGHAFHVLTRDSRWHAITWAAYADRVERVAFALSASGIVRGDRVAICARTSLEWEVAQMASLRLGATVVGLDTAYADDLLAKLVAQLNIAVFIAQDLATLARIPDGLCEQFKLVLTIEKGVSSQSAAHSLAELEALAVKVPALGVPPHPDDEALVVFSSGTTGSPKPVSYCHGQLSLALDAILDAFSDIPEGSALVSWLPVGSSRVDLQACKLEYSIVSPK